MNIARLLSNIIGDWRCCAGSDKMIMMKMVEGEAFLDGARRLDRLVLGHLFDAYFPQIYRYVVFRVGEQHASNAIARQVFFDLLEAVSEHRGPRRNLAGWLFQAAANRVRAYMTGAAIMSTGSNSETVAGSEADIDLGGSNFLRQHRLQIIFQQLDPVHQHVLALRFSNLFNLDDLSRLLGKPTRTIKDMQFNALKALERALHSAV